MPSRPVTPKRWKTLVALGTAASLAPSAALYAGAPTAPANVNAGYAEVWLAQASGESGEGGESGATEGATPDAAYLTRLALVEGHLVGATLMYARGMTDQGAALAGHPEAEMMDDVRASLAARNAPDFSDALDRVGEVMFDAAPSAEVEEAMADLHTEIAKAEAAVNLPDRAYFDTILALTNAAAHGYKTATETGSVEDAFAYHEAYGFVRVAGALAQSLEKSADPVTAKAAAKAHAALEKVMTEFGDMSDPVPYAGDASAIYGAAANVELAGLAVK